jgi:TM2 domain-containing membrane protein YozV
LKTSKTTLQIIIGLLVIGAFAFFIMPEPMQNVEYLQGNLYHYSGESVITDEQFLGMALDESYDFRLDSYESHSEGFVLVEYDTYSDADLPFLERLPYAVGDMPSLHNFSLGWVSGIVVILVAVAVCFTLFLWMKYLGSYFGSRKVDRFFDAVLYRLLRFWDGLGGRKGVGGATVVDEVTVDVKGVKGICAVRTWGLFWGDKLRSTGKGTVWKDRALTADKPPTEENAHGVYAYRTGVASLNRQVIGLVFGIVDMTGRFEYHSNGVIRAERGEILLLVCNRGWYNKGRRISAKYGIPVVFVKDTSEAYHGWLFGENGVECLEHNRKTLEGRAG